MYILIRYKHYRPNLIPHQCNSSLQVLGGSLGQLFSLGTVLVFWMNHNGACGTDF